MLFKLILFTSTFCLIWQQLQLVHGNNDQNQNITMKIYHTKNYYTHHQQEQQQQQQQQKDQDHHRTGKNNQ
ncbi:hypothetical protein DERF_006034 [Dermatophagoides farinae]|uniref:Uncharacterized protein n=1 Tax=Dermatophagoides farinae TaxID=6954 RepID=A0A922I873_DERFA|nr:hypothetical protein DERF_006034 [Dermatophagoides farinae]